MTIEVGIGSPAGIPGAPPAVVLDWARRADEGPFSSLGVIDRLRYGNYDPLATLAAAAAVTSRIRLATSILIAPLRATVSLAKEAASIHALSGGRLVLGVSVGARADDYELAGLDYRSRGRVLTDQLAAMREHWAAGDLLGSGGDGRPGGPTVLVGGASGAALARMARYADGFAHAGGPPRAFARAAEAAEIAWADAGRPGRPRLLGMGYFALGDGAADAGRAYIRDYYAFTGAFAERIAEGVAVTPRAVTELVSGYADAGCDELLLFPTVPAADQLDRLARALS